MRSKKGFTLSTKLALTGIILTSAGCNDPGLFDCIDNDGPKFNTTQISNPVLNQPYSDTITVEIQNELFDDSFRYRFTHSGDLPTGISASAMGRRYMLEGTPTAQGPFSFTVQVTVDNELTIRPGPNGAMTEDNGLCFLEASRTFEVVVQP